MSVSASIPATVQIRRRHLLGLIGAAAALAACVTWVVTAFAFDTVTSEAVSTPQATSTRVGAAQRSPATFTMTRKQIEGLSTMAQPTGRHTDPIMSRTPAQLAAGPALQSALASMSPQTRRYTKAVMSLTFAQLAAGAAGHP
jgi:hypothetical protein